MWTELIATQPALVWTFAIWLALCVGSFLNVVIHRVPIMLQREFETEARLVLELTPEPEPAEPFNLLVPRSRCPHCGHQITAWENIPLLSWLLLRGRCSACSAAISARYPLVELLTALLSAAALYVFGFTWLGAAVMLATWMLVAMSFIDYDTHLLPDQLTLPLLWLGLIVNLIPLSGGITPLGHAVVGAIAGYLVLWSLFWAFKLLTGKEGMGYGDFKLLAALGAWMGWQVLPALLLIASVAGVCYALATGLFKAARRDQPMPFGPFLAVGGWVCLMARDNLLGWYGF